MKVAISGSRTFTDRRLVERVVDRLLAKGDRLLVACGDTGCTAGVDTFAHAHLDERGLQDEKDYDLFIAQWRRYGKRAGFIRNEEMIKRAGVLVAFLSPGPVPTPGTAHAMLLAQRRGLEMHVYQDGKWTSLERMA